MIGKRSVLKILTQTKKRKLPDRFDVCYGMTDIRIGLARLDLPDVLPPEGVAVPLKNKV